MGAVNNNYMDLWRFTITAICYLLKIDSMNLLNSIGQTIFYTAKINIHYMLHNEVLLLCVTPCI